MRCNHRPGRNPVTGPRVTVFFFLVKLEGFSKGQGKTKHINTVLNADVLATPVNGLYRGINSVQMLIS